MQYYDALKRAGDNAGVSMADVGRAIGKAASYVSGARARGSVPSVANAAAMLGVCGYALAAVPIDQLPDSALVLDVPPADAAAAKAIAARRRADAAARVAAKAAAIADAAERAAGVGTD